VKMEGEHALDSQQNDSEQNCSVKVDGKKLI
jgi:hypothetical protein